MSIAVSRPAAAVSPTTSAAAPSTASNVAVVSPFSPASPASAAPLNTSAWRATPTVTGFAPALAPVTGGQPNGLVARLSGFKGIDVPTSAKPAAATAVDATQQARDAGDLVKRLLTFGGMASCAVAMLFMSSCTTMTPGGAPGRASITQTSPLSTPVRQALAACDGSAASIARCRTAVAGMNLSAGEKAAAYRGITEKVQYRNQRNTPEIGDSMCNVTSLAMGLNGLGVGADESHVEFEKRLSDELSGKGLRRTDEGERLAVARSRGVDASTIYVRGAFHDGAGAKAWYGHNVQPKLDKGAQAIMSITVAGASGHVLHIVGCDNNGLVVNDPYSGNGRKNDTTTQSGYGRHVTLSWDFVADHNASKYVQVLTR